jgi:hypothetical protein
VLDLCKALDELLQQWERSKGNLSLQDSFHARHIAISYLPEALNTYLSIPARFATTKLLDNGKTAVDTFKDSMAELEGKVRQLGDDLASQDAHAFLVHSKFLQPEVRTRNPLDEPAARRSACPKRPARPVCPDTRRMRTTMPTLTETAVAVPSRSSRRRSSPPWRWPRSARPRCR